MISTRGKTDTEGQRKYFKCFPLSLSVLSSLVTCNLTLHCRSNRFVQVSLSLPQGAKLITPCLSFLCIVSTFSITSIAVGYNYLFLSVLCDTAWYNLMHHSKVRDRAWISESEIRYPFFTNSYLLVIYLVL